MCGGVSYKVQDKKQVVYFPNPQARLPLLKKDGSLDYIDWGRRESQEGSLPLGGWARHESIKSGVWNKYNPKPVKIVVDEYMEKTWQKESVWYDVKADTFIQGLLAYWNDEIKVYVVTVKPDLEMQKLHKRLPRIVFA